MLFSEYRESWPGTRKVSDGQTQYGDPEGTSILKSTGVEINEVDNLTIPEQEKE